jgi:hypothetical protein
VLIFCPTGLEGELDTRITASGAVLLDAGEPGFLYRLSAHGVRHTRRTKGVSGPKAQ